MTSIDFKAKIENILKGGGSVHDNIEINEHYLDKVLDKNNS